MSDGLMIVALVAWALSGWLIACGFWLVRFRYLTVCDMIASLSCCITGPITFAVFGIVWLLEKIEFGECRIVFELRRKP